MSPTGSHLEPNSINVLGLAGTLAINGGNGDEVVEARGEALHHEPGLGLLHGSQEGVGGSLVHAPHEPLRQSSVTSCRAAHLQRPHSQLHQSAVLHGVGRTCGTSYGALIVQLSM